MQNYEYFNKEWLVSAGARRVYRMAAGVSLLLYPALLAAGLHQKISLFKPLLLIAVFATVLNEVGMGHFLFHFDDSHPLKQVLWACALFFMPLGPALYCFLVYSRSNAIRKVCESQPDSIGGLR
jgi:hypothetical protein